MAPFKSLPFFIQTFADKSNGGFPLSMEFHLYFDNELKMFRQASSDNLNEILDRVYKQGSLVDGSLSSESGQAYILQTVNYIQNNFCGSKASRILEIGFGSGIILKELKKNGYTNLTGIEPGSHQYVDGLEGINLIKDFFPSSQLTEKFDLIFSLLVLEHIEDPLQYINSIARNLTKDGKIILAVPNCEPYLLHGDISIFIHEHFSYFTEEAIIALVGKTGLTLENISIIEGAFIFTIGNGQSYTGQNVKAFSEQMYMRKITEHVEQLRALFNRFDQQDIAIYNPIRALNMLHLMDMNSVRLIDDNSQIKGKYLAGQEMPIESFQELADNPPRCLLIYSRTFGERIKNKCISDARLNNTFVATLEELDSIKFEYEK